MIYALIVTIAFVQAPRLAVHPDYLAEKFVSSELWGSSYPRPDFKASKKVIDTYRLAGYYTINARTKHIDTLFRKALEDGARQVVMLGARYDSRAYRFQEASPSVTFFEVDLPITQAEKKRRVAEIIGSVLDKVAYVPIDFNKQTLREVLKRAGCDEKLETFFIWEGVTMYIEEDAVDSTIRFIAQNSAPSSSVAFDYVFRGIIEGETKDRACTRAMTKVAMKGEPWIFGMEKEETERFLEERGLRVISNLGAEDETRRYLRRSDGTIDGEMFKCGGILFGVVPRAGTK